MSDELVSLVAKILMKREGYGEEEAMAVAEALKEKGKIRDLEEMLKGIGVAAENLSSLSEEAQKAIAPYVTASMATTMSGGSDDDFVKKLATVKALFSGKDDGRIKELTDELKELKEKLSEKEKQELLEEVRKLVKPLYDRLSEEEEGGEEKPRSEIEELKAKIQEYMKLKESVEELFGRKEAVEKEGFDITKAREELEKLGYEVRGPITPKEFEERMKKIMSDYEQRMKEREKELEKEIAERLKLNQKQQEMLATLGTSLLEAVFSVMGPSKGAGTFQKLKEAMMAAKGGK